MACWTACSQVQAALCALAARDLCLVLAPGCPGPDRLVWHPASDHGVAAFERFEAARGAVMRRIAASDGAAGSMRMIATARRVPSVDHLVARRFGDPARWLALGPVEATRRLHAAWGEGGGGGGGLRVQARRNAPVASANSAATTATGVGHPVR